MDHESGLPSAVDFSEGRLADSRCVLHHLGRRQWDTVRANRSYNHDRARWALR